MSYDYAGARKSGVSDREIADYLSQKPNRTPEDDSLLATIRSPRRYDATPLPDNLHEVAPSPVAPPSPRRGPAPPGTAADATYRWLLAHPKDMENDNRITSLIGSTFNDLSMGAPLFFAGPGGSQYFNPATDMSPGLGLVGVSTALARLHQRLNPGRNTLQDMAALFGRL